MYLTDFADAFVAFILQYYLWADSIYPFRDVPISFWWLFESTILWSLAWQLFPDDFADLFVNDDDLNY